MFNDDIINKLYLENDYIRKNPSLHQEDSEWKISKIIPLIDKIIVNIHKEELNLLDVGGGKGLILNAVAFHIENNHQIKVKKYALDLSPEILEFQKKTNPDLERALNENINDTSINDNEIDIALLIDVLEHVEHPLKALSEIKRISRFSIFKVPLEDNLFNRTYDLVSRGKTREHNIKKFGHINFYNFYILKNQIEEYAGQIENIQFTNVNEFYKDSEPYNGLKIHYKLINSLSIYLFKLSPLLNCLIFFDFVVITVKCD